MSRNGRHRPYVWLARGKGDAFYTKATDSFPSFLVGIPIKMPCSCRPPRFACAFTNHNLHKKMRLTCKNCMATRHAFVFWEEKRVVHV